MKIKVMMYLTLMMKMEMISSFGGWGPGEHYGHTGPDPPLFNPNAMFGFDAFGLTNIKFYYRSELKLL